MSTPSFIPFSDYEATLTESGYEAGAPSPLRMVEEIDGGICAKLRCANCGHEGMAYAPYTKPGSYLAHAVCPECGYWEEF